MGIESEILELKRDNARLHTLLELRKANHDLRDELASTGDVQSIRVRFIQRRFCEILKLHPLAMINDDRRPEIVQPRAMAMGLARRMTKLSLSRLAALFGGKHHGTILHADRRADCIRGKDLVYMRAWNQVVLELESMK